MKKTIFFLSLFLLSIVALSAQDTIVVRGNVFDMSGEPLIWVTVEVKKMYSSEKIDVKTDTDIDGNYEIKIPKDISEPVLVFSYIGHENQEIPVRGRSVIDVELMDRGDNLSDDIVYLEKVAVEFSGGLPDTYFGAGLHFYNKPILGRYLKIPCSMRFSGDASYSTDFSDNARVSARLDGFGAGMGYVNFNASFDRYDISDKQMNMNLYSLGYTFFQYLRFPLGGVKIEYFNQRIMGGKDHVSLKLISKFYPLKRAGMNLYGDVGVSHRGRVQFLGGVLIGQRKYIPFGTKIEAGMWMNRFRGKAEISRANKWVELALGYERFHRYENAYISVKITTSLISTGFIYGNHLKKKNE